MALGIEKIENLLKAVEAVGVGAAKVLEDGEVTLLDVRFLPAMFFPLKTALEGMKEAIAEGKDLDQDEASMLVGEMLETLTKVLEAFHVQMLAK